MSLKKKIKSLLQDNNTDGLRQLAHQEHGILRILISLAYDKEDILCWRAIEAIGVVAATIAKKSPETARNLIGRLLWTIREESGGIGWSSPEMLGEIVRNCPDDFPDVAPVIASFYDEDMLRPGVMRALMRISEVRPDLVKSAINLVGLSLKNNDPIEKAYAMMFAGHLRDTSYLADIKNFLNDDTKVSIYQNGDFRVLTIRKIAEQTVILLSGRKK